MHALNINALAAATVVAAAGMVSVPVFAEGAPAASPGALHLTQGFDADNGTGSAPSLGVQAVSSSDIGLHGGLDRDEPDILGGRPNIVQYRFGLRIPF